MPHIFSLDIYYLSRDVPSRVFCSEVQKLYNVFLYNGVVFLFNGGSLEEFKDYCKNSNQIRNMFNIFNIYVSSMIPCVT